jgi:hypothetical protein
MMLDSSKVNKRDETETKTMSGRSQGQSYIVGREKKECCRRWCRVPVAANVALTSHRMTGRREESG